MKNFFRKAFWYSLLIFFIFVFGSWLIGLWPGIVYSDGHRSGVIYKFSKKGLFYKTWEGELSLGMTETDAAGAIIPRVFDFSVSRPAIATKIEEAERSGKRITLHYQEFMGRGCYYGSTRYDILEVEE